MQGSSSDDDGSDMQPERQRNSEEDSSSESDCHDRSSFYDNKDERQQLIKITRTSDFKESFQLEVDHAVLEKVLLSCGGRPVSIINTIGDRRSGKSLMMNHVIQKLKSPGVAKAQWLTRIKQAKGFPYKPGYHPVTQGIWVWNEALIIQNDDDEEMAVIVMDTQGFSEEYTTAEEILLLTGISVLSSSFLIVNLIGEFPEAALEWLSPISRCGQLCVKNGVKTPFQRISYLIRDWSMLQRYGPWGDKGGSKLLKKMLEEVKSNGGKLSPVFEDIGCTLLPHIGEKALKKTQCGNSTALCTEFVMRYAKYINEHVDPDNLPVKRVLENNLDPDSFKTFFLAYVQMFNEALTGDGLSPQVYWETTMQAAEKVKTDRGLAEYRNVIRQHTKVTGDRVLSAADINSLHVSAQKKCINAFRKFQVPKSEEAIMEKNIRDILAKETEQLTTTNRHTWERQLQHKLEEGQRRIRSQMEKKYPFLFSANSNFIFCDDAELARVHDDMVVCWVNDAVEEMECENEEDAESLKVEYLHVLHQHGREYKTKNADFREAAEEKMGAVVSNLTLEYSLAIDDMVKILPNVDGATLEALHDKEKKVVEHKFREFAVGTPHYQEVWATKLKEGVEKELNMRVVNLESTMMSALERVSKTEKNYGTHLEEIAMAKRMNDDEIKTYHDQHVKPILEDFKNSNPFPVQSPQNLKILGKLKNSLNKVCIDVLQAGKHRKARVEEFYSEAVTTVLDELKVTLEGELNAVGFCDVAQFKESSFRLKNKSLERISEILRRVEDRDKAGLLQKQDELAEKIEGYLNREEDKNRRRLTEAENLATQTLQDCINKLEMRMTTAVKNLDTREELLEEHRRATHDAIEQFRTQTGFRNNNFLEKYCEHVRADAEKMFEEIDDFFKTKKDGENAALISIIADVKQTYREEMTRLTSTGAGHLSEVALEEANEKATNAAMMVISPEVNLSPSKKEVVKNHLGKIYETFRDKNALAAQSFQENNIAIGIDLGTTYCCVAVYLHGKVQVLRNDVGANTTPSYVCITPSGDCIFGQNAKKWAHKFPESTIFDAKRILGRAWEDEELKNDQAYWPFTVKEVDGVPQIEVHGKYYHPEKISSMLLRHLKEGAEKQLQVTISKAVITVPAYFTDGQRQATVDAGQLAGLEVLGILNEPSAAALEYRYEWFHDTEPRNVLVYDLGGGTFDVAVLKMGEKSIDVLSVNGDSHLGGEDFDQNMMKYCAEMFEKANGVDLFKGKDSEDETVKKPVRRRLRRLQTQCEDGKKQLMTAPSTNISVDAFLGEDDLDVDINREEFEERNLARFQRTIDIVHKALKEAGVKKEEIKDVILVGGSTRIPKIQRMLQEYLGGKTLNERINPDEAVARGAAIQAAMLNCPKGVTLFDFGVIKEVTPMSLGVEMANSQFDVIIPKNTKFPVEHKEVYGTQHVDQTTVGIKIFQGEYKVAKKNKLLGNFTLLGIKESVEVVMTIDNNGILKVEARCPSTGSCHGITVREERGGMSKHQKQKLLAATC